MALCINCVSGDVIPGTPRGQIQKIGPYDTYVSKPSSSENQTGNDKAVVLFTDVFGLALTNIKLIADIISDRTGITTFVPDLFHGKPIDPAGMSIPSSATEIRGKSFVSKITTTAKMLTFAPWVYRNWPTSKYNDVETFLSALKETQSVKRVGASGYCYGGKLAIDFNTKGLVDVTVVNHPSFVNASSFADLKGPILFNCAEEDDMFPVKTVEQVRAMLDNNDKAPKHDFKVFKGTAHSFCARPNLADEHVKKGFEEATSRTADWFKSHL
ncbi:alpha/beta-hydrolase [Meira miltonrushii]|uniref:Alpha/beta-hydrolase n=1 Tax=Meira miltonrushii TaxID=1280837 RepID=A0A316V634_9BASI|nr:alpha/beta-hydrolase [Meira miltonrushii]PWN33020.1 alpha/beta-hydrolase [Meira miltonrushii]